MNHHSSLELPKSIIGNRNLDRPLVWEKSRLATKIQDFLSANCFKTETSDKKI